MVLHASVLTKYLFRSILTITILSVIHCTDSIDKSPFEYQHINKDTTFDGVSSATKRLTIKDREIGSSSISMHIWYEYHNGDTWIRLGLTDTTIDTPITFIVIDTLYDSLYDTTYDTTYEIILIDTIFDTISTNPLEIDTLIDTTFDSTSISQIDTVEEFIEIQVSFDSTFSFIEDTTYNSTYGFEESLNKYPNFFLRKIDNKYMFDGLVPNTSYFIWIYGERYKNATDTADVWEVKMEFTTK